MAGIGFEAAGTKISEERLAMWVLFCAVLLVGSVGLYVLVRYAGKLQVPDGQLQIAMLTASLPIFALAAFLRGDSWKINGSQAALIVLAAVVFSYGGNRASLIGIRLAPNPGYSLVIAKSYVIFTSVVMVVMTGSLLPWSQACGILGVVLGATMITRGQSLAVVEAAEVDESKASRSGASSSAASAPGRSRFAWVGWSMLAFLGWGMLSLVTRHLTQQGVPTLTFLTYLLFVVAAFSAVIDGHKVFSGAGRIRNQLVRFNEIPVTKHGPVGRRDAVLLGAIGLFSAAFNYGNFMAISTAPHVGYANAVNAGSIAFVTLGAALVFGDHLSKSALLGVVLVIGSLILVVT